MDNTTLTLPMPRTSINILYNSSSSARSNFLVDKRPSAKRPARSRTAKCVQIVGSCHFDNALTIFCPPAAKSGAAQSRDILGDNLMCGWEEVRPSESCKDQRLARLSRDDGLTWNPQDSPEEMGQIGARIYVL